MYYFPCDCHYQAWSHLIITLNNKSPFCLLHQQAWWQKASVDSALFKHIGI
jgi:hypothetical protein